MNLNDIIFDESYDACGNDPAGNNSAGNDPDKDKIHRDCKGRFLVKSSSDAFSIKISTLRNHSLLRCFILVLFLRFPRLVFSKLQFIIYEYIR